MSYTDTIINGVLREERIRDEVIEIYIRNLADGMEAIIYRGWGGYAVQVRTDDGRLDSCVNNFANAIIYNNETHARRILPSLPTGLREAFEAYLVGVPFADIVA